VERARRDELGVSREVGAVGVEPELVELAGGGGGGAAAQARHGGPARAVAERVLRAEQVPWRGAARPSSAPAVAAHVRGGVARPLAGLVRGVDVQGGAGHVGERDVEVEAEEVVAGLVDVDLFRFRFFVFGFREGEREGVRTKTGKESPLFVSEASSRCEERGTRGGRRRERGGRGQGSEERKGGSSKRGFV